MNGYTGSILRIHLTTGTISTIKTGDYASWGGGHGIGSALFYDIVVKENKRDLSTLSGFDPGNVITIMTSPLSGTLVPGASSRTEVQGIGVQTTPEWFTRGNLGGRFSAMLKYAGWDGIVIEGKADKPVWIDIRNQDVTIADAASLWGKDTWKTQEEIWSTVTGGASFDNWFELEDASGTSRSTQRPAVLTIGPGGEMMSRMGCLLHDAGSACGQGGFGGVWGSKNLKAISVMGTGSLSIADPNALMKARLWAKNGYSYDLNNPENSAWTWFGANSTDQIVWSHGGNARVHSCIGCTLGCHERTEKALGNDSNCIETAVYYFKDMSKHLRKTDASLISTSLVQKYGFNAKEIVNGLNYIIKLNKAGVMGPGLELDCDLPFDQVGETEFFVKFIDMIVNKEGLGADMAEGFYRAAKTWGRLEEDLSSGILDYAYWGMPTHSYDPRCEPYWGYGSILGDRDINEHCFSFIFWKLSLNFGKGPLDAETLVTIVTDKMEPYEGDPFMLDFNTDNQYSEHVAKMVAWQRHYTRFWKQSALYCDIKWPDFVNTRQPDNKGLTVEGEPKFFNAVTGGTMTFLEGMELGRKIWNLDNAIWTLQGRHRDMVRFAEFIYTVPYKGYGPNAFYYLPWYENGAWTYKNVVGRCLDSDKFEDFKTLYYRLEGWDEKTGWPKRSTLESLGLADVADELDAQGKCGA